MSSTVVVIGGARGIGGAIAESLGEDPTITRLVVADIDLALATETCGAIAPSANATATFVDLSDAASVEQLVKETNVADRVVIASGIFTAAPATDVDLDAFRHVLDVNLIGAFHAAQLYAAHMVTRGSGSIVAVASIAARMPRMRQAAYASSKAGLRQALRVLAMEVAADGVRINTVSPGPTDTEMMRSLAADHSSVDDLALGSIEAFRPRIPDGRVATTMDIANAVKFLLSADAGHIVMQDLVIDGGELLGM
jgi:2,3-dihydro-2,3-dihydroxybenzoate dehydrogenase